MLDDELLIETPERVELHYILANIGNRFLAAAIDHLIQALLVVVLFLGLGLIADWHFGATFNTWIAALAVLILFAIYWGYFVLFETFWSGQTPGKRIMKLRVVREDGRPIRFFEAFIRNLLRIIDILPPFSYAIGVTTIIFSPRSKRIGDLVAGTVVVKERAAEAPSLDDIIRLSESEAKKLQRAAPAPFKANTRLLSDRELQAVETFLNRRYELNEPNRSMLAARIAQAVVVKLNLTHLQLPPEIVLEEIERQHRVQSRYLD
ncbi:MAG: RDD family protein [Acidobacteria bacterium]|nr:RDD family protein [Acidobacteriota bacterium]